MIEVLILALPVLLGLVLPRILLRRRPDAPRWHLLVGAPVLALLIGYVTLALIWVVAQFFLPWIGAQGYHVVALAEVLSVAMAGILLAPVCALVKAAWITREGAR